ncbi:MAG: Primosomal protein N' [Chlamydiales bacterium]|nr:Primosomal protein N' [Chlamydiales bacterium]
MLDYGIADEDLHKIFPGSHVEVSIRGQKVHGIVYELLDECSFKKVAPVSAILSESPLLPPHLFELAKWMSRYYLTPFRLVLKSMLPKAVRSNMQAKEQLFVSRNATFELLRATCSELQRSHPAQAKVLEALLASKEGLFLSELLEKTGGSKSPVESLAKRKLIALGKVRVDRSQLIGESYFRTKAKALIPEQQEALEKIVADLEAKRFRTHLLFGVTGSGKTEVYMQAIERALALGKGAIMLVPEIALTTQTCERLLSRFEQKIAILHHRLSAGERLDAFEKIHKGEVEIVVGARSALFSPLPKLGLVIVDEEQDSAYKQGEGSFGYHARDCAVMLGKLAGATVVLGSATPSVESFHNAKEGKYVLSKLMKRPTARQLPAVKIIDMRREFEKAKGYTSFSEELIDGIKRRYQNGEQSILFLNRRGYHTSLSCKACGYTFKCPHCDVSLTFHRKQDKLMCHLCEHTRQDFANCGGCGARSDMQFRGVGTEQIERALKAVLPDVRCMRIDGDTTKHKGSHDKLFRQFSTQKADVLIGTQIIAKGLHFPGVTLVAILNSDGGLNIPDFRASEQIFQLVVQVAGRAGRGELPGEVMIQTHMPENATIRLASKQDYEAFFNQEIETREMFGYPPFTHFTKVRFSGEDADLVERVGSRFRSKINVGVVHPLVPSGHAKVKDQFRFHFLIRATSPSQIQQAILRAKQEVAIPKSCQMRIDVDPISTFF